MEHLNRLPTATEMRSAGREGKKEEGGGDEGESGMCGRVQRKEARKVKRWGSERGGDKAAHLEVQQFNMKNNEEVKEKLSKS